MSRIVMLTVLFAVAAAPSGPPQTVEVVLGSHYIRPDTVRVRANRPVTLVIRNEAAVIPHNFVVEAAQAGIDIRKEVPARAVASVTFTPTLTGSFRMFCDKKLPFTRSHRDKGMEGWLEVVE